MSQTGYTPILIYSSSTGGNTPAAGNLTNSTLGSELAINITDGKLFYKDNGGSVQVIGWKTVPTTAGGTGLTSYTAGDTLYYASGTTLSKLAIGASKTIMTSSGTAPQWSASLDTSQGGTGNTSYTAGDMNYYASGTAFTKLAIGSAYQALQVNAGGTAPSWQPSATSVLTTQGDLLYASAANTLARLAKNTTATRYLSNTGTSNNPAWAQVDLTNGVTGTLPVANGGTGNITGAATAVTSNATSGVMQIVGPGSGTTRVMTIPNANFTAARTDAAQTFSGLQTVSQISSVNTTNTVYTANIGGTNYGMDVGSNGNSNTCTAINFNSNYGTTVGSITAGATTAYNTTSDYRLKQNVTPMNNRLADVMKLKPVTYNWKYDDSPGEGFIAHELAEVCPYAVTGEKDAVNEDGSIKPQSIDTSFLIATLVAAIQELKSDFDAYVKAH